MAVTVTHLTKEGYEDLRNKVEDLKSRKRQEIIKRIEIARGFGDLSENSEYDEAKQAHAENEAEIAQLEEVLKNCVIIEDDGSTDTVKMGHFVTLYDYEFDEEVKFHIVGSYQADPRAMKISNESPIGKAVIGKAIGDEFEVAIPAGTAKYKVLEITRQ